MSIRSLPLHALVGSASALLIVTGVLAQEPKSSPQPSDAGLLAGPPVEEEATVQSGGRQGLVPGARRQQESLPIRVWINAVRDLGLSTEQQAQVQAIVSEFQTAQRRYQQAHGEQLGALQQQAREARADGKEPEPAVREALQRLESESPKAIDAQRRIWGVLNETQQAQMRERLAELEKQAQERRRTGERAPDAGAPTPNAQPATDEMMTGASAGAAGAKPGDSAMTGSNDMGGMMSGGEGGAAGEATSANQPTMRERARERRRGAANATGALDDNARRRVAFLEQHQAAGRAGNAPSAEERTFRFAEDEDKD